MTCERRYTPAAIADLQRIAEAVEAERRRQHWAEFAQELREALHQRMAMYKAPPVTNFEYVAGLGNGLTLAVMILDELSPAISCDNPIE